MPFVAPPDPEASCPFCNREGMVGRERQFVGRDAVSVYKCHHCNSTWHVPDDGRPPYVPPPKPRSF
jgi:transposase-like protein